MLTPTGVLVCPPDHFDVVDEKNPHMAGQAPVDPLAARAQWEVLCAVFDHVGLHVETVAATPGCEDMVFAANQAFSGPGRVAVLSRMRHASRQREVPAFADWFAAHGYTVIESPCLFEGGGDAVWDPRGDRIFLGHGFRTDPAAADTLAQTFGVEVTPLELVDERYYHLDTCLCILDNRTAIAHLAAFSDPGPLRERFETILEPPPTEAWFACNAAAFGKHVVLDRRARITMELLDRPSVHAVDTGEFLKSGGSVYCLKHSLFDPV